MCQKTWPFPSTKSNGKDQHFAEYMHHGLKEKNLIFKSDANLAVKKNIVATITGFWL